MYIEIQKEQAQIPVKEWSYEEESGQAGKKSKSMLLYVFLGKLPQEGVVQI